MVKDRSIYHSTEATRLRQPVFDGRSKWIVWPSVAFLASGGGRSKIRLTGPLIVWPSHGCPYFGKGSITPDGTIEVVDLEYPHVRAPLSDYRSPRSLHNLLSCLPQGLIVQVCVPAGGRHLRVSEQGADQWQRRPVADQH
jgi:hypothetical protein